VNLTALYFVAFAGAFVSGLASLPPWRRWCLRNGLVDEPGHRKIHGEPVPLAGGLAVITALAVPTLIAIVLVLLQRTGISWEEDGPGGVEHRTLYLSLLDAETLPLMRYGLKARALELGAIFLGAIGMLIVGVLDDRHELRPIAKFSGQFVVAALVAAAGVRVTLFVPSTFFSFAITILWILTVINAFNFMDNMNGLCAGLGAIAAFQFAAIAGAAGQYLVALLAALTCGALAGFLPYNFPRARSFLGDAGSHLIGYLLAVLAILPHFHTPEQPRAWAVLSPLLVLAIPLADLVRVVLVRWKLGKPFYVGDTNHLSHRLVQLGLSRAKAVLLLWLIALIIGTLPLVWARR
jgi:UDP-GlcNAc:undecaprenyl-phosphate GlcNAc-1-phosphate transferase